jgi:hypothetical protein
VPVCSADSPTRTRSAAPSARCVWTCESRPLDHGAPRCLRRVGCAPGLHIRMTHRPASRPLDDPHRRWTHGPSTRTARRKAGSAPTGPPSRPPDQAAPCDWAATTFRCLIEN